MNYHHIITEMGRQSFTPKETAIGGDVLLEIPRNHLVQQVAAHSLENLENLELPEKLKVKKDRISLEVRDF